MALLSLLTAMLWYVYGIRLYRTRRYGFVGIFAYTQYVKECVMTHEIYFLTYIPDINHFCAPTLVLLSQFEV